MQDEHVEAVIITERVNGWWVSVRYDSGHEEHHGPFLDEDSARSEAYLFSPYPIDDPEALTLG
jgi:hypothetical protein